ncbi:MAG: class I SAM-dependent methyltransferase [Chloroflexi bacterium]|nr:MAG: class I SAM-dependent methyltransferase [Chloroflexota bacterium]
MKLWWRLIQFGFHLLYNQLAFTYDMVSWLVSLGSWRHWQRAVIPFLPPPADVPILELAHGTGNLQLDLLAAGYQTIGYDLSPYMGRIARRKLLRAGYQMRLVRGKAQQLPFPTGVFAAVVVTFPTAFIIEPATLKEAHRVLSDDGVLIVVSGGMLTGGGLLKRFIEWLYVITGQRKSHLSLHYFEDFGFTVSLEQVACPRSIAQVLIARKI